MRKTAKNPKSRQSESWKRVDTRVLPKHIKKQECLVHDSYMRASILYTEHWNPGIAGIRNVEVASHLCYTPLWHGARYFCISSHLYTVTHLQLYSEVQDCGRQSHVHMNVLLWVALQYYQNVRPHNVKCYNDSWTMTWIGFGRKC